MSKKILLLEDDYELAQTLEELLEENGYDVTLVYSGDDAIEAAYENSFDLYIFDINLGDMNGLDLLESLRQADDNTPAVFISALIDLNSISKAFRIGADDYIKKPFFPEELLIRIDAKMVQNKATRIVYNTIEYDTATRSFYKDGHIFSLGEVQECLALNFMQNINKVMDKSILLECLSHPSDAALRVALNKLKQTTGFVIKNIRGVGYILEES